MTDLKPEDLEYAWLRSISTYVRERGLTVGEARGRMEEFHRVVTPEVIDSLLADRARMEKALRETTDALLNAAAALEHLQESSENGAESIKTIGSADPGVTVHMFGLLADSARRAAKYAREGASQ